jgi:hypothetical protein
MRVTLLTVVGLALSECLAAETSSAIRLPPWFRDNAVIPPASKTALFETAYLVVSGEAAGSRLPEVWFSTWPEKLRAKSLEEGSTTSCRRAWQLSTRDLKGDLPAGTRLNLKASLAESAKVPKATITSTNWVVGSVWLLIVDPDRDSHQMPEPTGEALRRVRVLALESGDTWREAEGSWLTLEEAWKRDVPLLSGMPRAFANAIVDQGPGGPIGLILRLKSACELDANIGQKLGGQSGASGSPVTPEFSAGTKACAAANHGTAFGAYVRSQRENERLMAELRKLKREGTVGDPINSDYSKWQYAIPGEEAASRAQGKQPLVPFRVTGVVW